MGMHMSDIFIEKGPDVMLKNVVKEFLGINAREDKDTNGNTI